MSKELALAKEPDVKAVSIIGEEKSGGWSRGGILEEDLKERIRQQKHNRLTLKPWEGCSDFPERTYEEALIPLTDLYRLAPPED